VFNRFNISFENLLPWRFRAPAQEGIADIFLMVFWLKKWELGIDNLVVLGVLGLFPVRITGLQLRIGKTINAILIQPDAASTLDPEVTTLHVIATCKTRFGDAEIWQAGVSANF
jgi:hypothetical protein